MAKGMHIRKDDSVIVIAGKDKGKTGRVLRTEPGRRRVFVEGLNIVKRHTQAALGQGHPEGAVVRDHRAGGADRRLQRHAPRPDR